jgi:DNA-binding response OmpR family regulator
MITMSKVLVVDDSDLWCSAVALELGKAGYSVIRARHHVEALAAAAEERPDLVMVDVLLAARAGAGFVRQMRSIPTMKDTPMLLTTTGTERAAVQGAMGVAAEEIMPKSRQSLDDLSQRLRAIGISA